MEIDEWAAATAAGFLEGLPRRWRHTRGVADAARRVDRVLEPADRPVLRAAAYLHDIGYSDRLAALSFHPIDGARWLDGAGYPRLAGLVAHHSGARYEADLRRMSAELASYVDERSDASDALAYCDLTTGPEGQAMTLLERLADVTTRYGSDHLVTRAVHAAAPELAETVARVQARLQLVPDGSPDQPAVTPLA